MRAFLFVLASCGTVAPPIDAGNDGGSDVAVDAIGDAVNDDGVAYGDAAPTGCNLAKPFGAPVLIASVSSASDDTTPRISSDELSLYFSSARVGGTNHLFVATRPSFAAPFAAPTQLANVSSSNEDIDPTVSTDQLSLFFSSLRSGGSGGGYDVWNATRTSTTAPFSNLTSPASVNSISDEAQPFLRADGQELWFASDRAGGAGQVDVYRAPVSGGGFATPVAVTELNTPTMDWLPALSNDGLAIFWSSDRTDGSSQGGFDIWTGTRTALGDPFGATSNVQELDSTQDDLMGSVSPNGCRVYFTSNRALTNGQDIYVAERPF